MGHHCCPLHFVRTNKMQNNSRNNNSYRVKLGKHNLENDEEKGALTIRLAKIVKHYNYNDMLSRNEIALVKLDTPVTFTDTIKPACLPEEGAVLPNGAPCYVSGWGLPQ